MASETAQPDNEDAPGAPASLPRPDTDKAHTGMSGTNAPGRVQYAEYDAHAAPEVVGGVIASDGPSWAVQGVQGGATTDVPGLDPGQVGGGSCPDGPKQGSDQGPRKLEAYACLCQSWKRARQKPYLVAAVVAFVVGIVALTALPIVLHRMSIGVSGPDR